MSSKVLVGKCLWDLLKIPVNFDSLLPILFTCGCQFNVSLISKTRKLNSIVLQVKMLFALSYKCKLILR